MSEPGQRRPQPEDLDPILELIWEGKSLRAACGKLELHVPSTSDWLHEDEGRREQYARAREGRAEFIAEDALTINRAAALGAKVGENKVDASGAKGYLEAAKWRIGQMVPKMAPRQNIDLTARTRQMTDEEIAAELAALEHAEATED